MGVYLPTKCYVSSLILTRFYPPKTNPKKTPPSLWWGNRLHVTIVNNGKDYLKFTSKASYMSWKIFSNNFVATPKNNLVQEFNEIALIGMCTSDLSKVLMLEVHYDYIKNKYDNKSKLLLTDTNSTAQKIMFSIKDFFNKCDRIRNFLRIWSHLLKKSTTENFIFCAV